MESHNPPAHVQDHENVHLQLLPLTALRSLIPIKLTINPIDAANIMGMPGICGGSNKRIRPHTEYKKKEELARYCLQAMLKSPL